MIKYVTGNIFNSTCKILVNTVNCQGVMGKGLAKQFKQNYPEMFNEYKRWCKWGAQPGNLFWWVESAMLFSNTNHIICNFPTKNEWYYSSKLEYIEQGLKTFVKEVKTLKGVNSVAFPKLGCANGKLNWSDVKPLMEKYLSELEMYIEIYE